MINDGLNSEPDQEIVNIQMNSFRHSQEEDKSETREESQLTQKSTIEDIEEAILA